MKENFELGQDVWVKGHIVAITQHPNGKKSTVVYYEIASTEVYYGIASTDNRRKYGLGFLTKAENIKLR